MTYKSIQDKGGLDVHIKEQGIEPSYFYHLDDLKLNNLTIAKLLNDKYQKRVHRVTVAKWRKLRSGNNETEAHKS